MRAYLLISFILLLSFRSELSSQSVDRADTLSKAPHTLLYGNLYHQHHDFFEHAFSFQGAELGIVTSRNWLLGIYSAAFASNLSTNIQDKTHYVWIAQTGIFAGKIWNEKKWIHPGCQLNAGYFQLRADETNFALFDTRFTSIQLNGFVFSPQFFSEFNTCKWLKIRTGLSYNSYVYGNHPIIKSGDLQNISFTFGMILGNFDR
jgi:hypothetical protein